MFAKSLGILAAFILGLVLAGTAHGAVWLQYHSGPAHLGVNPFETELGENRARELDQDCQGVTGGPDTASSSPALVSGLAIIGSANSKVVAFKQRTCEPAWSAPTGAPVAGTAAGRGVVIVGTVGNGVQAFDVQTGAPRWHAPLPGFFSHPTIAGRTAFIASSDGDQGHVFALDVETGAVRWSKLFARTGSAPGAPTVKNGRVFVGYASQQLRAFRASDGKALWTRTGFGPILGTSAADRGLLYFGGGDNLWAVDQVTGATVDVQPSGGPAPLASSPAIADGVVWVRTRDHTLRAFNQDDLSPRFVLPMGGEDPEAGNAIANASPSIANGVVYVSSSDRRLYAFATDDGELLMSVATFGQVWGAPAIANGRVWVGAVDTRCLVCSFRGFGPVP
jgi:outer membrane protein assembly factor BamB